MRRLQFRDNEAGPSVVEKEPICQPNQRGAGEVITGDGLEHAHSSLSSFYYDQFN